MKTKAIFAGICLALSTSAVVADATPSIRVEGARERQSLNKDQRAVASCLTFFIADILPGNANIRVTDSTHSQVFSKVPLYSSRRMEVTMDASAASDGKLLAKGTCTVDRGAAVIDMSTKKLDPDRLAVSAIKDLRFVATTR